MFPLSMCSGLQNDVINYHRLVSAIVNRPSPPTEDWDFMGTDENLSEKKLREKSKQKNRYAEADLGLYQNTRFVTRTPKSADDTLLFYYY